MAEEELMLENLDEDIEKDEVELNENIANMEIDSEIQAFKARVREMEAEAEKLQQMELVVGTHLTRPAAELATVPLALEEKEEKQEIDTRSVYVGNVDYGATAEELESHFHGCGVINRVTILCNKTDGHPMGFAYIEFGSKEFVETALTMNETIFRGRQLKVMSKRTNRPGFSTTNRFARGSFRGRGARTSRGYSHSAYRGTRRSMGYSGRDNYYAPY